MSTKVSLEKEDVKPVETVEYSGTTFKEVFFALLIAVLLSVAIYVGDSIFKFPKLSSLMFMLMSIGIGLVSSVTSVWMCRNDKKSVTIATSSVSVPASDPASIIICAEAAEAGVEAVAEIIGTMLS